jgi:hypothetical protein
MNMIAFNSKIVEGIGYEMKKPADFPQPIHAYAIDQSIDDAHNIRKKFNIQLKMKLFVTVFRFHSFIFFICR